MATATAIETSTLTFRISAAPPTSRGGGDGPRGMIIDCMELDETFDRVCDQQSFLTFVRALIADREGEVAKERAKPSSTYGPGANGWENGTIEAFLDAAASWAESSEFGRMQFGEAQPNFDDNPWRQFANFLYCGKIYE